MADNILLEILKKPNKKGDIKFKQLLSQFDYIAKELKRTGVTPGPQIKEILHQLHRARLDGKITTKQDEESLVNTWLAHNIE